MMKGMKYRVSITGQEIFCDGATVWTYDVAAKEVQVDRKQDEIMMTEQPNSETIKKLENGTF